MTATTETPTPGPGRPRNADRVQQHAPVAGERETMRDAAREQPRTRTRMRRESVMDDPFYIPPHIIPEDQSWEWKRFSVNGMEDPFYLAQMRRQGWEPVEPRNALELIPPNYTLPTIIKGGQLLMERPKSLTEEAMAEMRQMARQQTIEAEERLGRTPRELSSKDLGSDAKVRATVHKEWNRPVPIEE